MRGGMGNPYFRNQNQQPYQNRGGHVGGGFKANQPSQVAANVNVTPQKPQENKPAIQSPPAQAPNLAQQSNNKTPTTPQTASPANVTPKIQSPPPQNNANVKNPDLGSPQNQPKQNNFRGGMGNGQKPHVQPAKKEPEQPPQHSQKSDDVAQSQVKLTPNYLRLSFTEGESVMCASRVDIIVLIGFLLYS